MFYSTCIKSYIFLIVFVAVTSTAICSRPKFATLNAVKSYTDLKDQAIATKQLIHRVIGQRSDIDVVITGQYSKNNNNDFVQLQTSNGKLTITASSGVSASYGFNHYLKYFCRKHISWAGDQIKGIPSPLPSIPNNKTLINSPVKYRYYQNVCTVSYSSVWWNWTRWEREIDWMALNGINLPLAFTGQEAIWDRIYKTLGCSQSEIDMHFTGPAFLAWGRMGNLFGFGGPLSQSWKANQLTLQHQILGKMKSLGMIPVLPGFAGHIPAAIARLYPKAEVSKLTSWSHFNCSYSCTLLLEPHDPLFNKIGSMFIDEQIKEYNGTNHIYNADTFNEMTPRSDNIEYLANSSKAIFNAMITSDSKAIWLMQGWLFHNEPTFWKQPQIKALITAVPQGRLMILDLFSEAYPQYDRTSNYYGQPFIWCMLHDFGGNMGFYGKADTINSVPHTTLLNTTNMIGTGITPEGIDQNYVIYDLMLEVGFTVQPVNLTTWFAEYAMRRYNTTDQNAINTWISLGRTIYNDATPGFPPKTMIRGAVVKRPSLKTVGLPYWYDDTSLFKIWDSFILSLNNLQDIETVRYDAVDITRQMLQAIHRIVYYAIVQEYEKKNEVKVIELGGMLLDVLDDFDRILFTDSHFMMGCWIRDARLLGEDANERDQFEYNARNQVTLWGPAGEIADYASKHWASLVKHYYRPRWSMFMDYLKDSLERGTEFNQKNFDDELFLIIEEPFSKYKITYPTVPTENSLDVTKELYIKWRGTFN